LDRSLDNAGSATGGLPSRADSTSRVGSRPRPPKFYRIGEVVTYCGLSRQTVHNYTIMGLLHEAQWTKGGHRLYDESVFSRLDLIAELKAQGRHLAAIREYCDRMDGNAAQADGGFDQSKSGLIAEQGSDKT